MTNVRWKVLGGTLWVWLDRATTLATFVAAVCLALWLFARPTAEIPSDRRITQPVEDVVALRLRTQLPTHTLGSDGARLALVEFGDFECPFCAQHATKTVPELQKKFIEHGRLRYGFRHYPLASHRGAFDAAIAAECAGKQGRFWELKAALFADPASVASRDIRRHIDEIIPDQKAHMHCAGTKSLPDIVRADWQEGQRLGVKATPTFFIGRVESDGRAIALTKRVNGAQPLNVFLAVLTDLERVQSPAP